jgi:hypothetical protein
MEESGGRTGDSDAMEDEDDADKDEVSLPLLKPETGVTSGGAVSGEG